MNRRLILRSSSKLEESQSTCFHNGLSIGDLPDPCRSFYEQLIHFKFDDKDFISGIEHSLRHPQGWCHQKIIEKSKHFGRHHRKISSIRLEIDSLIIEIFPPGYSSPIRHHQYISGMFRVLHGSIAIHLFPCLTNQSQMKSSMEYLVEKDQLTWMLPKFNQTHQMKNIQLNSSAIVIQKFENKDKQCLDYFLPENRVIRPMTLLSADISFKEFQEKIKNEWNQRCS